MTYKLKSNNAKRQLDGLKLNGRVRMGSGDGSGQSPFLVPYTGKKAHLCQGMTKIASVTEDVSILDTQAFHYNDDTLNVLVFRGTKGKRDLMADGFAPKIGFLAGKVHQEWQVELDRARQERTQAAMQMDMPIAPASISSSSGNRNPGWSRRCASRKPISSESGTSAAGGVIQPPVAEAPFPGLAAGHGPCHRCSRSRPRP